MNKNLLLDLLEQSITEIDAYLDSINVPTGKEPEPVVDVMDQFADPMDKLMSVITKTLQPQPQMPIRVYPEYDLFVMRDQLIRAHGFVKFNL